jgi:hemoglobin
MSRNEAKGLDETKSLYEAIGGALTIQSLVEAFYPKVYADQELAPLFPDGVESIKYKQYLFLTQFTGGPALYSDKYGPPQMQRRHLAFEVTPRRAEAWLRCMKEAMDEIELSGPPRQWFYERLMQVAQYMVNTGEVDKDIHGREGESS